MYIRIHNYTVTTKKQFTMVVLRFVNQSSMEMFTKSFMKSNFLTKIHRPRHNSCSKFSLKLIPCNDCMKWRLPFRAFIMYRNYVSADEGH